MTDKSSWETFFDQHAEVYNENVFTRNTLEEVDFLVETLGLAPGAAILDVACGTGRHSVELARRGYRMTGLDFSAGMLAKAAEAARAAGVEVEWVRGDATSFSFPRRFDAALCLCEGAFGLLGRDDDPIEQPLAILRNIAACLRPGAKCVFTLLNGLRRIRQYGGADVEAGRFDPLLLVESGEYPPREGLPPVPVRERGFVPTELVLLFRLAGIPVQSITGAKLGQWGATKSLDPDDMEIMVVAQLPGE